MPEATGLSASPVSRHRLLQALKISSLLYLDSATADVQKDVESLLRAQAADGSWPAAAFCLDPYRRGKPAYAGAAALTTAFCLEALQLYSDSRQPEAAPRKRSRPSPYDEVVKLAKHNISQLPNRELRQDVRRLLQRILRQDSDRQIILLPWLVSEVTGTELNDGLLRLAALANLWGWMAYTVFDDFLDGEGRPSELPAALVCQRNLLAVLAQILPANQTFQTEVQFILGRIDAANAWEQVHCRATVKNGILQFKHLPDYGDYWQLADRSLGHSIAALAVLYGAGCNGDADELQAIRRFFQHYLIARQLDDDLHDWETDLRRGHINATAAMILRRYPALYAGKQPRLVLTSAIPKMRLRLWENCVPDICADIQKHVDHARQALLPLTTWQTSKLLALLEPHEKSARQALAGRQASLDFIKSMMA